MQQPLAKAFLTLAEKLKAEKTKAIFLAKLNLSEDFFQNLNQKIQSYGGFLCKILTKLQLFDVKVGKRLEISLINAKLGPLGRKIWHFFLKNHKNVTKLKSIFV